MKETGKLETAIKRIPIEKEREKLKEKLKIELNFN